jgi:hypothetical protein
MIVPACLAALVGCDSGISRPGWVSLYNGQDVIGWTTRHEDRLGNAWQPAKAVSVDPANKNQLVISPGTGILVNGPTGKTCDIITAQEFGDCEAHIEFVVPGGSNSGVYFMGEYEIQIFDSYGKEKVTFGDCGGIYSRWIDNQNVEGHPPRVNVSRAPGKWQSFDVVFRAPRFDVGGRKIENARFVSVKHNGVLVHENVSLNGVTRGGLTGEEKTRGPIMIQGDHGPVAFRNLRIKPLDKAE